MLGIIGGNGVAATNRLLQLIEQKVVEMGGFRDAHHPEMIIWQATQVPSRSMYLEGRGESFIPGYVKVGKQLKACGCTQLCMCCNTAHYAIDELSQQINLPFINIMEEVSKTCNELGSKKVGMMCTDGLKKIRIYEKYFNQENPEIELLYPNEEMQRLVTLGICNAKNCKRNDPSGEEYPEKLYNRVCDWFVEQGVDCIVGGCTDISAVFSPKEWNGVQYIDSLKVLANKILENYKF